MFSGQLELIFLFVPFHCGLLTPRNQHCTDGHPRSSKHTCLLTHLLCVMLTKFTDSCLSISNHEGLHVYSDRYNLHFTRDSNAFNQEWPMPDMHSPPMLRADIPHLLWESILSLAARPDFRVFLNISAGQDRLWIGHTK